MIKWLRLLFGLRASTDISPDLHQFAVSLMQAGKALDGDFLAHLSSACVQFDDRGNVHPMLDAERLRRAQVLACWVWRDNRWKPCSAAEFLAQRGQQGAKWTEFAVWLETDERAYLVEQWLFQVLKNRRGGAGSTRILQRTPKGWLASEELSHAWRI